MHARTTHASLLARLADTADTDAWRHFLDHYGDLLRGFGRRRGLHAEECDDVVQDVVAALVPAMATFEYDPQRGRFRGFLKTIAVRAIARRAARGAKVVGDGTLADAAACTEDESRAEAQWEMEWRQHHVRTAMRTIDAEFGSRDRAAFQRYGVDGAEVRDVAEALGMSIDQVYQAKSRILRRLSEVVAVQVAEEG